MQKFTSRHAKISRRKEKVAERKQSGRGSRFESAKPPKPERGRRREGTTDETSRTTHARTLLKAKEPRRQARAGQGRPRASGQQAIMLSHESRAYDLLPTRNRVRKQTLRQPPPCLAAWLPRDMPSPIQHQRGLKEFIALFLTNIEHVPGV